MKAILNVAILGALAGLAYSDYLYGRSGKEALAALALAFSAGVALKVLNEK